MTRLLALCLLAAMLFCSRVEWRNGHFQWQAVGPYSGDEKGYDIEIRSLLFERSLEMESAYDHYPAQPAHQVFCVNRLTGQSVNWFVATPAQCAPAVAYQEASHPLAFAALMTVILWTARATPETMYRVMADAMVVMAWAGVMIAWRLAGWQAAVVLLASPWLAYEKSLFSEIPAGVCLAMAWWVR